MKYCINCKHSLMGPVEYICMRPVPNDKADLLVTGELNKPLRLSCQGERASIYHCGNSGNFWEAKDNE